MLSPGVHAASAASVRGPSAALTPVGAVEIEAQLIERHQTVIDAEDLLRRSDVTDHGPMSHTTRPKLAEDLLRRPDVGPAGLEPATERL